MITLWLLQGMGNAHSAEPASCSATGTGAGTEGDYCAKIKLEPMQCSVHSDKNFSGLHLKIQNPGASLHLSQTSQELNEVANNCTPLMLAAGSGRLDSLAALIEAGAHLEEMNDDGETAILTAVRHGQPAALRFLLERGAKWNYRTVSGISPFWEAVQRGDRHIAELLLAKGADANETGDGGVGVLARALTTSDNDLARLLLKHGANVNGGQGDVRWLPLGVALSFGNVEGALLLIKAGADTRQTNSGAPAWFYALQSRDAKGLQKMLETDINLNERAQRNDETPLIAAAHAGHVKAVQLLIQAGAKPDAQDAGGNTALAYASSGTQPVVVEMLLQAGAEKELANRQGLTPFQRAALHERYDIMRLLRERGANINHARVDGMTALLDAVRSGNLRLVRFLIALGADPFARSNNNNGFLNHAALSGNPSLILLARELNLLEIPVHADGTQPLHQAAGLGALRSTQELLKLSPASLNAPGPMNATPLHVAIRGNHIDVAQFLLTVGANPNLTDQDQMTPLMVAAQKGNLRILKNLLGAEAEVKPIDKNEHNALHHALLGGDYPDIIRTLHKADADIHQSKTQSHTALSLAALMSRPQSLKALIDLGAKTSTQDRLGNTPLLNALISACAACAKSLIAAGANVQLANNAGSSPLQIASGSGQQNFVGMLLASGANVNHRDNEGVTALMNAATSGHQVIALQLLDAGADLNARNRYGRTALDLAAREGRLETLKLLLKRRAHINGSDNNGNTALHHAAAAGRTEVVAELLAAGADKFKPNLQGKIPLMLATEHAATSSLLSKNPK